MRIIKGVQIGLSSDDGGSVRILPLMAIIFAGFAVVGLLLRKSHWTTSSQEHTRTCLTLIIFNQPMDIVIIEKGHSAGRQSSIATHTSF